jgi:hypothetical protein
MSIDEITLWNARTPPMMQQLHGSKEILKRVLFPKRAYRRTSTPLSVAMGHFHSTTTPPVFSQSTNEFGSFHFTKISLVSK